LNVVGALRQSVAQWCADGFGDGSKWLIGTAITNDKGGAIAIPHSLQIPRYALLATARKLEKPRRSVSKGRRYCATAR
jgi:hypothetical protein